MELPPSPSLTRKYSTTHTCPLHLLPLDTVSMQPSSSFRLICIKCASTIPNSLPYNVFVNLCRERTVQLRQLQSELKESIKLKEMKHIEGINRLREEFDQFMKAVIEKDVYPFFKEVYEMCEEAANPDVILNSVEELAEGKGKTAEEMNELIQVIARNLAFSDENSGLQLRFGSSLFNTGIQNEVENLTDAVDHLSSSIQSQLLNKLQHFYEITRSNIINLSQADNQIKEKMTLSNSDTHSIQNIKYKLKRSSTEKFGEISDFIVVEESYQPLLISSYPNGYVRIFDYESLQVKKTFAFDWQEEELIVQKESGDLVGGAVSLIGGKHQEKKGLYCKSPILLHLPVSQILMVGAGDKLRSYSLGKEFNFLTETQTKGGRSFTALFGIEEEGLVLAAKENVLAVYQKNLIKLTDHELETPLTSLLYLNTLHLETLILAGSQDGSLFFLSLIGKGESIKRLFKTSPVHSGPITFLQSRGEKAFSFSKNDGNVIFEWDCERFEVVRKIEHNFLGGIVYSPVDGFFLGGGEKGLDFVNQVSGRMEGKVEWEGKVGCLSWRREKGELAVGGEIIDVLELEC